MGNFRNFPQSKKSALTCNFFTEQQNLIDNFIELKSSSRSTKDYQFKLFTDSIIQLQNLMIPALHSQI
jgi:hypothetical protein